SDGMPICSIQNPASSSPKTHLHHLRLRQQKMGQHHPIKHPSSVHPHDRCPSLAASSLPSARASSHGATSFPLVDDDPPRSMAARPQQCETHHAQISMDSKVGQRSSAIHRADDRSMESMAIA
ncbi:hypothetical protein ACLOJK_035161, partial [Asimina triloba]